MYCMKGFSFALWCWQQLLFIVKGIALLAAGSSVCSVCLHTGNKLLLPVQCNNQDSHKRNSTLEERHVTIISKSDICVSVIMASLQPASQSVCNWRTSTAEHSPSGEADCHSAFFLNSSSRSLSWTWFTHCELHPLCSFRLVLVGLFPYMICAFLICPTCAACPAHPHHPWFRHPKIVNSRNHDLVRPCAVLPFLLDPNVFSCISFSNAHTLQKYTFAMSQSIRLWKGMCMCEYCLLCGSLQSLIGSSYFQTQRNRQQKRYCL